MFTHANCHLVAINGRGLDEKTASERWISIHSSSLSMSKWEMSGAHCSSVDVNMQDGTGVARNFN